MTTTTATFKVAMDNEQKKLKNFHEVKFEVDFDGVEDSLIREHAMANMVVRWQGQIRNNWEKFIKDGIPEKVTFGVPLYGTSTKTRAPSESDIENHFTKLWEQATTEQRTMFMETGNIHDLK